MSKPFIFDGQSDDGKAAFILYTQGDLRIKINTDDVDTYEAACLTRKMLSVLNAHFNDPKFASLDPERDPVGDSDGDEEELWEKRYEEGKAIFKSLQEKEGNAQ